VINYIDLIIKIKILHIYYKKKSNKKMIPAFHCAITISCNCIKIFGSPSGTKCLIFLIVEKIIQLALFVTIKEKLESNFVDSFDKKDI